MRSLRCFHLILLLVIGAVAARVLQQSGEPVSTTRLEALDHNRDGSLSRGELEGASAKSAQFPMIDQERVVARNARELQAELDAPPVQR